MGREDLRDRDKKGKVVRAEAGNDSEEAVAVGVMLVGLAAVEAGADNLEVAAEDDFSANR